jgi:hypothetical protein
MIIGIHMGVMASSLAMFAVFLVIAARARASCPALNSDSRARAKLIRRLGPDDTSSYFHGAQRGNTPVTTPTIPAAVTPTRLSTADRRLKYVVDFRPGSAAYFGTFGNGPRAQVGAS